MPSIAPTAATQPAAITPAGNPNNAVKAAVASPALPTSLPIPPTRDDSSSPFKASFNSSTPDETPLNSKNAVTIPPSAVATPPRIVVNPLSFEPDAAKTSTPSPAAFVALLSPVSSLMILFKLFHAFNMVRNWKNPESFAAVNSANLNPAITVAIPFSMFAISLTDLRSIQSAIALRNFINASLFTNLTTAFATSIIAVPRAVNTFSTRSFVMSFETSTILSRKLANSLELTNLARALPIFPIASVMPV